jgi:hypothetical protein
MKNLLILLVLVIALSSCGARSVSEQIDRHHSRVVKSIDDMDLSISGDYVKVDDSTYLDLLVIDSPTTGIVYYDSVIYNTSTDKVVYQFTLDNRRDTSKVTVVSSK